jgi:hypothetical protein
MKRVWSFTANLASISLMLRISKQFALAFGLLTASGTCAPFFSSPLAAQQSAEAAFTTPDISARNQIAENREVTGTRKASNLSPEADSSTLPDAPVPNIAQAADASPQGASTVPASAPAPATSASPLPDSAIAAPVTATAPAANDPVNMPIVAPTTFPFHERVTIYTHSFLTPESLVAPLVAAGISQAEDTPHEWGRGGTGFGRRVASSYGQNAIARTIEFGVATLDHEDPRYHPSDQTGIWPRTRHAIVATFVSPTTSGGSEPAYSRFAGVYGAAFIANAWEPPSQDSAVHGLERGSLSLLSRVGWNVFKEFWPSIRGPIHLGHN